MSNFDLIKERDLSITDVHSKYIAGKKTDDFEDVKNLKPIFSFDYVSIQGGDFCFNGQLISRKDLINLIKGLKEVSGYSYGVLNRERGFHFHEVNWDEVALPESSFYKCIYKDNDTERIITPYQFKIYDKARIIGFIYKGVFYLVMLDRNHKAYKRK